MRTALCVAIALAVPVSVVPASLAYGKSAGTGIEAKEPQTHRGLGSNTGVSVELPIGKVWVDPELLAGEPVYERRTKVSGGITIVEVSTTPFMTVLASNQRLPGVRPDQPAGW